MRSVEQMQYNALPFHGVYDRYEIAVARQKRGRADPVLHGEHDEIRPEQQVNLLLPEERAALRVEPAGLDQAQADLEAGDAIDDIQETPLPFQPLEFFGRGPG